MAEYSRLDRAKTGDADAIASLLNQVLVPKGMTVRGKRLNDRLELWLESQSLPDQKWVVKTVRLGMERLQISSIRVVQIHWTHRQHPDKAWSEELILLGTAVSPDSSPAASTASSSPTSQPSTPENLPSIVRLEQAYYALQSDPKVSWQAIDEAYFRLRTELLRQGKRDAIAELKAAHALFKANLQQAALQAQPSVTEVDAVTVAIDTLVGLLRSRGLEGRARIHNSQLQIRLEPGSAQNPNRIVAIIYTWLERDELTALRTNNVSEVGIYAMASPQKISWKRLIPMPLPETVDNRDLMSFKNHHINTFGLPILMLLGMAMNTVPLVNFLLRGIKIWFHEFGHATIAWLAGRRAIPLPFGWTNVDPERSLFVYLGLLLLFGLMFWVGRREQKRWTMLLAGILIVLQFWFTWLLPISRFETLLSFGGIGGELYLCTLLIVSFYFPLPAYWRWDFYRYPVVLGAAFTFWGQFWLWQQINRGIEEIPWGSMWGGPSDGDMNNLSNAGWSDQQIIGTYTTLSHVCLIALLGIYLYYGIQQNRHYLFALSQRWLARGS